MVQEVNKVDQAIACYRDLKKDTLQKFCIKQNLNVLGVMAYTEGEVICFTLELNMAFKDIFLDLHLNIERGVAVGYMKSFYNGAIDKSLSYKEYLKGKKLI